MGLISASLSYRCMCLIFIKWCSFIGLIFTHAQHRDKLSLSSCSCQQHSLFCFVFSGEHSKQASLSFMLNIKWHRNHFLCVEPSRDFSRSSLCVSVFWTFMPPFHTISLYSSATAIMLLHPHSSLYASYIQSSVSSSVCSCSTLLSSDCLSPLHS